MDRIEIYQEIRSMQIAYSFHFVFYSVLGIIHLLIILLIFWNDIIHKKVFIAFSILDVIMLIYPIIPLVLMYRIILKKHLTKIFKFISIILIIASLVFGITINIFYWINLKSTTNFSKECPYNLNDINIFTTDENFSDKCNKKRCVLESINNYEDYPYNYICNFNSEEDFEVDPTKQYPVTNEDGSEHYIRFVIKCEKKNDINELFVDNNNKNNQIDTYLQKCWNNNDLKGFYLCKRYEYPEKFKVDFDFECPPNNYNKYLIVTGIFLIFLDVILAFIPWSLDCRSYSTIILFDSSEEENVEIDNNDNNQARHNETNTSSHNRNGEENNQNENGNENNNNQNNNIGSENNEGNEYVHQPTETIIIVKDKKTNNNSSNIKSSDRLNSGLNSNDMSKSNVVNNSNNTKKKIKKNENIIGSLISQSESQNMISKTSEKENESEDSKSMGKKNILLRKNNFIKGIDKNLIDNENDEINFNNNIKYDQYHNDNDEDEKDVGNKIEQNNCLIKNKNININNIILNNKNKNQETLNNKPKIKIILKNEERNNINIKEANNSVKTTIVQRNKEEKSENNKNNNNSESGDEIKKFEPIIENINEHYHTRTPKKEIKSLNFNFSQVLTNIRESDNVTLFKNTNGSIIKEERKEETERSIKGTEEEKNNSHKSKNDKKRINLSMLTPPTKMKNKSKDKDNKNENKMKNYLKSNSQSSLIVDSNRNSNCSRENDNY